MNAPAREIENTIPILPVADLDRSIRFYTEVLGFSIDWTAGAIASVSRDGCPIMLSHSQDGAGTGWIWIGLEDDSLFDQYRRRGVKIRQEPQNHSWAYEMKFEDVDGNVLWLGTEPKK
jgi:catechol 2,3-dioxygenase-like lactoylglutathione lyase family enzyme